jgi:hypothetical protein
MASPENMSFFRKTTDRVIEVGNTVDKFTIALGVLFLNAPVIASGALSLIAGKYVQNQLKT